MDVVALYAAGAFVLLLAGLLYLTFVTWLLFCWSLARLPNGESLFERAPRVIESFDIRSWSEALLPWKILTRAMRRLMQGNGPSGLPAADTRGDADRKAYAPSQAAAEHTEA
ncbi:hypothetical protein [Micromonospora robiginosa]|uniref:Uncharacterized protein n=1 Tax=Micromonospora robiginosa TaxID=2749844 RepID=A0A7L6B9N4_9ACTN|nr:hypothetical protein [Micromonospora ferruginea]QLQ38653.1 hypothetical protein H1D33_07380 [Micromonospora ferruginea]